MNNNKNPSPEEKKIDKNEEKEKKRKRKKITDERGNQYNLTHKLLSSTEYKKKPPEISFTKESDSYNSFVI